MALRRRRLRRQDLDRALAALDAQAVLTRRAGAEACRQVGEEARPVSRVADELGVCWWTVMNAVIEHGTPLVDDPHRIGAVRQLGVDETSFLRPTVTTPPSTPPAWSTCEAKVLIDMVEGNAAADLRRWTANARPVMARRHRGGGHRPGRVVPRRAVTRLDHATRVADPFHVVRVANRCLDKVRRRVQNETLGHRGRKARSAVSDPQAAARRRRAPRRAGQHRMLLGLRVGDPTTRPSLRARYNRLTKRIGRKRGQSYAIAHSMLIAIWWGMLTGLRLPGPRRRLLRPVQQHGRDPPPRPPTSRTSATTSPSRRPSPDPTPLTQHDPPTSGLRPDQLARLQTPQPPGEIHLSSQRSADAPPRFTAERAGHPWMSLSAETDL